VPPEIRPALAFCEPSAVSQQPTPFQTAYRLTIMGGTLVVASMAAYRYGPEPERLAETIDYVASMVNEVTGEATAEPNTLGSLDSAPLAEPAAFESAPNLWNEPTAPNNGAPRYDAAVQQASALVPIEEEEPPRAAGDFERLERERLTAPLLAAGATQADVAAWGRGAESVYRATASAPVSGDAAGLERRFDAIGATPEEAVQTLAAEVRSATMR
jgi:hypothetical protein